MLELLTLLTIAALALGAIVLVGLIFKVVFKVILFPLWLLLWAFKLTLGLVAGIVGLLFLVAAVALLPLVLVFLLIIGLPLLALAALFGVGWTVAAA